MLDLGDPQFDTLSPRLRRLLRTLDAANGQIVTYKDLIDAVYGKWKPATRNSIAQSVYEVTARYPKLCIRNVNDVGYVMIDEESCDSKQN